MVEQQVDAVLVAVDGNFVLPADEGKTGAQFEQKFSQVLDQAVLQFPFVVPLSQGQEIKVVRVAEQLPGEITLGVTV
ncbi:hypothetical protein Enr13x_73370 [Stieleria neptunia]|uniref:Uncharacterized protein n=1 Tax=Stieleria neptunia TaxID=2527979 RepID=A0A518I2W6_9BACT|nr:hypothetical protein Enr13x_61570 [Stieleria neptunia]QDV47428.1 hypothetical protein Enr13x_73370 [Stieleria neptunia]